MKNTIAYLVLLFNFIKLIAALMFLSLAMNCYGAVIHAHRFIAMFLISSGLCVLEIYRFYEMLSVKDNMREYGVLIANHPEYTVYDLAKAVKKEPEVVTKEIRQLIKKKVLFGSFDEYRFILDDDFELKKFMRQKGWGSAIF